MNAVTAEDLHYAYGEKLALAGVSFDVSPGSKVALLGPNGSGKSTLFKLMATLALPQKGSLRIFGKDPVRSLQDVRRSLGVVFQSPALDKKLTVRENLACQGALYGLPRKHAAARGEELVQAFALETVADEYVQNLSGGFRRRAEIAKALMPNPKLLLLDEPTTGLDVLSRKEVWKHLDALTAQGTTVIASTHWMEEADDASQVIILHRGKIIAEGSPHALRDSSGKERVSLVSQKPLELKKHLKERFSIEAQLLGGVLRFTPEKAFDASALVQYPKTHPEWVDSVTVAKASLEDFFLERTGETLQPVSA